MNANNPRPWKKDVTKGEWRWKVSKGTKDCGSFESRDGDVICWFGDSEQFYPTSGRSPTKANRKLILEASRVLHQTGMTPGELAERVEYLESLLSECAEYLLNAKLQIEYLHGRFGETGSGNGVVAQLEHCIGTVNRSAPCPTC